MIDPTGSYGAGPVGYGLLNNARQRLEQQATAQQQQVVGADPDYQMYGIFGPQYAATLARGRGASGGDLLREAALMARADNEAERYGMALREAGNRAVSEEGIKGYYDLAGHMMDREPVTLFSNTRRLQPREDGSGLFEVGVGDPVTAMVDAQYRGNAAWAAAQKDRSEAYQNLHEGGIYTPPETVMGGMTPPTQATPDNYGLFNPRGFNPDEENDANMLPIEQQKADAALLSANADMERARGGDTTITDVYYPGAAGPVHTVRQRGNGGGGAPPTAGADADNLEMSPQQRIRAQTAQQQGLQMLGGDGNGNIIFQDPRTGTLLATDPQGTTRVVQGGAQGGAN